MLRECPRPVSATSTTTSRRLAGAVARSARPDGACRPAASRRARWRRSPASACSSCIGSTRTSGRSGGRLDLELDPPLPQRLGEARQQCLHQPVEPLRHRPVRRGPAEAEQVADPAVEPVHLLDDRVELLGAAGESGWRRASWAAARRLASGFRRPWATAAAISPIDASFSDCTSCAWVRSSWATFCRRFRSSGRTRGPARRSRPGKSRGSGGPAGRCPRPPSRRSARGSAGRGCGR